MEAAGGAQPGSAEAVLQRLEPVAVLHEPQPVRAAAFNPAGDLLALGTNSKALRIAYVGDVLSHQSNRSAHRRKREHMRRLSDAGGRPLLRVLWSRPSHHAGSVFCCSWNGDGDLLATGSNDKLVKVVRVRQSSVGTSDLHHSFDENCAAEENGAHYGLDQDYLDCDDTPIKIDSSPQSDLILQSHDGTVRDVCFAGPEAGCHALLSAGGGDCTVRLWDVGVGCREPLRRLEGHSGAVHCVRQVGGDGRHIATGAADGVVRLWDLRCHASGTGTASAVAILQAPGQQVGVPTSEAPSVQPGGSAVLSLASVGVGQHGGGMYIASGHADNSCTVWDLRTRTVACRLHHHNSECRSVDGYLSGTNVTAHNLGPRPSSKWLLTASFDNTAAVVNIHPNRAQRRVLRTFNHDGARVLKARWHPHQVAFVSTAHAQHNTVRLWADCQQADQHNNKQ